MNEEQKKLLEQAQLLKEMQSMGENLRAAGIDFIICLVTEPGNVEGVEVHNISTDANVQDDHHYMDMMAAITETWWKANH
jgi:hypothetical protein